jgi:hypothetical protein
MKSERMKMKRLMALPILAAVLTAVAIGVRSYQAIVRPFDALATACSEAATQPCFSVPPVDR